MWKIERGVVMEKRLEREKLEQERGGSGESE